MQQPDVSDKPCIGRNRLQNAPDLLPRHTIGNAERMSNGTTSGTESSNRRAMCKEASASKTCVLLKRSVDQLSEKAVASV